MIVAMAVIIAAVAMSTTTSATTSATAKAVVGAIAIATITVMGVIVIAMIAKVTAVAVVVKQWYRLPHPLPGREIMRRACNDFCWWEEDHDSSRVVCHLSCGNNQCCDSGTKSGSLSLLKCMRWFQ